MSYITLTSDLHGYLFSVDHEGRLRRQRMPGARTDGIIPHGLGDVIGTQWGEVVELSAARTDGQLVLTGRTHAGGTVTARVAVTGVDTWKDVVPVPGQPVPPAAPGQPTEGALDRRPEFTLGGSTFSVGLDGSLRVRSDDGTEMGGRWTVVAPDPGGTKRYFPSGLSAVSYVDTEGTMFSREIQFDAVTRVPVGLGRRREVANGLGKWIKRPCEVEGYCWPQSATAGETITFHIRTRMERVPVMGPRRYGIDFVRLRVIPPRTRPPYADLLVRADAPKHGDAPTGRCPDLWNETGAGWDPSFDVTVAADWPSGVYAARLTDASKNHYYVPFVVRPLERRRSFALLANTNTWNAYNIWGGWSKYVANDNGHALTHDTPLSFQRPNPGLAPDLPPDGWGPYKDLALDEWTSHVGHLLRAELWVSEWLQSLGATYAFDTYADADLHAGRVPLLTAAGKPAYKGLILNTHPEYWTVEMYRAVEAFQAGGGNIVYLGGNGIYELVRIDGHRMYVYPESDLPHAGDSAVGTRDYYLTRNRNLAEHRLLGVGFDTTATTAEGDAFTPSVAATGHSILQGVSAGPWGTGSMRDGRAANGWEVDRRSAAWSPAAAKDERALVATAPPGSRPGGEMLYYLHECGGIVFSASSLSFGGSLAVDADLQRLVRNVLDECLKN